MTDRRFVLIDFTYMDRERCLRLYETRRTYIVPRAVAHAVASADSLPRNGFTAGQCSERSGRPRH